MCLKRAFDVTNICMNLRIVLFFLIKVFCDYVHSIKSSDNIKLSLGDLLIKTTRI
ncbi:predicted protein [Listeria monocytogenes FSL R2-503]|nr:predicted protein [Listeria monocytogenes FSL R2-503]